jgi:hypothetical protein
LKTDTGRDLQRDHAGRLRHLLTLEGLARDEIVHLLDLAQFYVREPGDLPARDGALLGRTVANLLSRVRALASPGSPPLAWARTWSTWTCTPPRA